MAQRLIRPLSCLAACLPLLAAHGQVPAELAEPSELAAENRSQDGDPDAPEAATARPDEPAANDAAEGGGGGEPAPGGAEDAAADVVDPSSPSDAPLLAPLEARAELDRLVAEGQLEAALTVGERLIELTEQQFGAESRQSLDAHVIVADVARRAGDAETAERLYLRAVDIGRAVDGVFSALAIEPLTGLGDTYHESGQYLEAISAYSEARTVNRRAYGLLNPTQIPLIDRITRSMESLDRHIDAEQLQLEALRLIERTYEPHSPEALAAVYKYADWLSGRSRYQEARDQYARAIRIIKGHYGDTSLELVTPLRAIGNSFRAQRLGDSQGHGALMDALMVLEMQPSPDPLTLAEVLRDLGDWAVAFGRMPYDGAEYRRAWALLGEVPDGERLRDEWFRGPEYVLREPISQRNLSNARDALDGHVLVRFDLTERGEPGNVTIVESEPPGLKDEAVLRHVRRSRFRPQIVDGEIVKATGLALHFTYRYKLDEAQASSR